MRSVDGAGGRGHLLLMAVARGHSSCTAVEVLCSVLTAASPCVVNLTETVLLNVIDTRLQSLGRAALVRWSRFNRFKALKIDQGQAQGMTGSGYSMNLFEVAREIAYRLTRIFLRDEDGIRPVFGGGEKFQRDPYWRGNLLFYEYFHGHNGAGLGASHQTGWTGVVAGLIKIFGTIDPER